MKISADVIINSKFKDVEEKVQRATEGALKDVVTEITYDTIANSPHQHGTNRRSIRMRINGLVAEIFSTSGYGGYLEVGTVKMPARPYFRPAFDRNIRNFGKYLKERLQ